ncbi:MAG: type IV pilus assembly protein PilM [Actinomycetota bacterium]
MSDSFWKKEISFSRNPKELQAEPEAAAAAAAPEPSTSFLKKEISFSRKPKAPKEPKAAKPAAESTSVLKKEISFSRKPKEPKAAKPVAESTSLLKKEISFSRKPKASKEPKPVAESTSLLKKEISFSRKPKEPKQPAAESTSFLKKEISFSRKPKEPKQPAAESTSFLKKEISFSRKPKEQTAPAADAESTSIWKKNVSLGKGKKETELERLMREAAQAIDPGYEAVPAPAVAPPTAIAEAVVAAMPPAEPEPVVDVPVVEAPVAEPPAPEAPIAVELPVAAETHAVEILDTSTPVEPAAVEPAPVEPAPVEPAPAPVAPEPVAPVAAAAVAPDPWVAGPELPPEPAPAVDPVVVHPPVPSAELPPLPEPKVPFWKKEIGGKKQPKQPKEAAASSTPFWKKELSLGKKEKAPKAPSSDSVPFWKRELGRKKPAPAAAVDAPTDVLPVAEKSSFLKKQLSLSLPSLSLPSRGGGHSAKKLVGLKVGASQIAVACVSNNGSVQLERVAREALTPGVVVGGELRDPDALGAALKSFFERHKLPKKGVRLGLSSNRIGVRIVEIAGVEEEKQLANAVQFRAQEALPIPLDEAVLDYRVLGESVDDEGQPVKRVLLVVAHRELVERYVDACRTAGISLAGIDLEAFALLRAMSPPSDRGQSALVAVSVGHDRSTFAVSDGRICEFTRVLEWGGWQFNVALARAFESTPSEVEALKRSLSLDNSVVPEGFSAEQTALAVDTIRRQVQAFARELVSSLQFYQNQPGSLGIGEIVLSGGTAELPGLAQELQRLIGVPVRVGDPLGRVVVSKRVAVPEQVGSMAVAIGLGIED